MCVPSIIRVGIGVSMEGPTSVISGVQDRREEEEDGGWGRDVIRELEGHGVEIA